MKLLNIPCFFISICCYLSCSPNLETIEIQNDAGVVIAKYTQNPKTKLKEGESYVYAEDGKLIEEAHYTNGQLNEKRILYHENGKIQAIEQYNKGLFEGLFKAFYENEQLELEGHYSAGKMNGLWKRYYPTGELMEIVTFVDNEENGAFQEFYKNGHPKAKGTYRKGDNEEGELLLFDETGTLIKKMACNMGRCQTTWEKEAQSI